MALTTYRQDLHVPNRKPPRGLVGGRVLTSRQVRDNCARLGLPVPRYLWGVPLQPMEVMAGGRMGVYGTAKWDREGMTFDGGASTITWGECLGLSAPLTIAAAFSYTTAQTDKRIFAFGSSSTNTPIVAVQTDASDGTKLAVWTRYLSSEEEAAYSIGTAANNGAVHCLVGQVTGAGLSSRSWCLDGTLGTAGGAVAASSLAGIDRIAVGGLQRAATAVTFDGTVYVGVVFDGLLPDASMRIVSQRWREIFTPPSRKLYVDLGGAPAAFKAYWARRRTNAIGGGLI